MIHQFFKRDNVISKIGAIFLRIACCTDRRAMQRDRARISCRTDARYGAERPVPRLFQASAAVLTK